MAVTDMGIDQTQVIENFSCGRDDRTGIGSGAPLFNGDGGGEAFDVIDIRFFELVQELPGIG
jgi:hypothetical protein